MEREFTAHHLKDVNSGLDHLIASVQSRKYSKDYLKYSTDDSMCCKHSIDYLKHSKYLKASSEALDACRTRLRRAWGLVRPGAVALSTGIECSRIRDSA